jgi:hypothetical protein
MKSLKPLLFLGFVFLGACSLGTNRIEYSNATAYITGFSIPATGKVGENLNISATGEAFSTCWQSIKVSFQRQADFNYNLVALGDYISYGGDCWDSEIAADTVITFKPETAGQYVVSVFTDPYTYVNDTIDVTE